MTIVTKLPITTDLETDEEMEPQPFLNETLAKQVLFSERKKPVQQQPKEATATKNLLKSLILEAWNEMV